MDDDELGVSAIRFVDGPCQRFVSRGRPIGPDDDPVRRRRGLRAAHDDDGARARPGSCVGDRAEQPRLGFPAPVPPTTSSVLFSAAATNCVRGEPVSTRSSNLTAGYRLRIVSTTTARSSPMIERVAASS
nr:hypothetical protein [Desertimonas flava]